MPKMPTDREMAPSIPTVRLVGRSYDHDCRPASAVSFVALCRGNSHRGEAILWVFDGERGVAIAFCPLCGYRLPATETEAEKAEKGAP